MSHHPLLVLEEVEEVQEVLRLLGQGVPQEERVVLEELGEPGEQVVVLVDL